jgi:hypothetical protein
VAETHGGGDVMMLVVVVGERGSGGEGVRFGDAGSQVCGAASEMRLQVPRDLSERRKSGRGGANNRVQAYRESLSTGALPRGASAGVLEWPGQQQQIRQSGG